MRFKPSIFAMLFLLGCQESLPTGSTADSNQQGVAPVPNSEYKGPGRMFDVTWTCRGTGITENNKLTQEEYCEWQEASIEDLNKVAFDCGAAKAERGDPLRACENSYIAKLGTQAAYSLAGSHSASSNLNSSSQLQCMFISAFDQNREFHMVRSINSYSALSGEENRNPFNKNGTGGLFGPCFDEGLTCDEAFASGLCVPKRASDPQVCAALNGLRKAGHRHLQIEKHQVIDIGSKKPGDSPVRMFLTFDSAIQSNCKYVADPKLPAGSQPDKTLVSCSVDKTQYQDCDALADMITVHARVIALDWDEVQKGTKLPEDTLFTIEEVKVPECYVFKGSSPFYTSASSSQIVDNLRVGDGAVRLLMSLDKIEGQRMHAEVYTGTAKGKSGWLEFSPKTLTKVEKIYCERSKKKP